MEWSRHFPNRASDSLACSRIPDLTFYNTETAILHCEIPDLTQPRLATALSTRDLPISELRQCFTSRPT